MNIGKGEASAEKNWGEDVVLDVMENELSQDLNRIKVFRILIS